MGFGTSPAAETLPKNWTIECGAFQSVQGFDADFQTIIIDFHLYSHA